MTLPNRPTGHPRWDPFTRRLRFTAEEMERMPSKEVTPLEVEGLMETWEWNGAWRYPDGVALREGELGHDLHYRYIEAREPS